MTNYIISRNSLNFACNADGSYVCRELASIPGRFAQIYKDNGRELIAHHLEAMGKAYRSKRNLTAAEELEGSAVDPRDLEGAKLFERAVRAQVFPEGTTLFEELLFWVSDGWRYYHPILSKEVYISSDNLNVMRKVMRDMYGMLVPCLPPQVQDTVKDMEIVRTALRGEHFAILFDDKRQEVRRIVTDTQLFELHGAYWHDYLDMLENGKPFARFACHRDGGRAFFDGRRLMSHERFDTCAPRVYPEIGGGYTVESRGVTVMSGKLLDEEKYSSKEPHWLGHFLPCGQRLLNTGFALCHWSEFVPYEI